MTLTMTLTSGILMIGAGLGVMAFGLWFFYAFLPLFYGLLGVGVGYWLGLALTGNTSLTAGILEAILAIAGGVIFAAAAYWLEPIRRILAGVAVGLSLALSIGYALGAGSLISLVLALGGAVIGGIVVPMVFDPLIVVGSALSGAATVMDGAHLIVPGVSFLDRASILAAGGLLPLLIWIVLGAVGLGWQFSNLKKWARPG